MLLHNVNDIMDCRSVFTKHMHNACKLFGLIFDNLQNGNVSVGINGQFKVSVTDHKRTVIEFVNELVNSAL